MSIRKCLIYPHRRREGQPDCDAAGEWRRAGGLSLADRRYPSEAEAWHR